MIPNSDDQVSFVVSEHGVLVTDITTQVTGIQVVCGLLPVSRVRTDIKTLFSRTCKDQIPGFPGLKKRFFKDFPGYTPFTNMVA